MANPTLNQLSAGFDAGRALADSSMYGHMISDDEVRKWVAVILEAALEADDPAPPAPSKKGKKS